MLIRKDMGMKMEFIRGALQKWEDRTKIVIIKWLMQGMNVPITSSARATVIMMLSETVAQKEGNIPIYSQ